MQLDFRAHAHKDLSAMHPAAEIGEFEVLLKAFDGVASEQVHQREHSFAPAGEPADLEEFSGLLAAFGDLPLLTQRPKTVLEIAGFPHTESVYSNMLAFFLDPQEEHGLGDLMLRSLLEAAGQTELEKLLRDAQVDISREEPTEERKRIDIVLFTSTLVVGIENKVDAKVDNPLEDYYTYLEKEAAPGRERVLAILLHLRPIDPARQCRVEGHEVPGVRPGRVGIGHDGRGGFPPAITHP
jgi:PD-(D/E)XK nuclease superfamily